MKFGIFYELQLPRPWKEGDEHRLYQNALSQLELADKLGYDYAWEVEHHFLEEFDVVRIDNFLVDLDCNDVARAVRRDFHFAAGRAHFDGFLLELGLSLRHLLLHFLRLLHQFV